MTEAVTEKSYGDAPRLAPGNPTIGGPAGLARRCRGRAIEVIGRTVSINRSRAQLYTFWRDFRICRSSWRTSSRHLG